MLDYNLISKAMKKLNIIYAGAISTVLLLSACNKDLQLKPYQQISQDQAIVTAQDVKVTLVGAYNRAGLADLYGGGAFLYPDMLADQTEISWHGTFDQITQMSDQALLVSNSFVDNNWLESYQVINQANNVLANISKVASADQNTTQGEAEFLRGLTYFDMARLYGRAWNDGDPTTNPGVPIITTPTTVISASSYVSRASVAQVYQQAIADLTDAEAKLPASNDFFANKYAAAAILARLYLQKGDYTNAQAQASTVINSGAFTLNTNYSDEFPYPGGNAVHVDNTPEDIFAIQVTAQQGTNALNTYYASKGNGGRGDIWIESSFVAGFEPNDTRAAMYNPDAGGVLRCDKFDNIFGNVHVIRLAEVYLIRAEAAYRISPASTDALNDVNTIRARAGIPPLVALTSVDQILTERVHELAFEGGFFLHDAKRLPPTTPALTVGALPVTSPKLVFPIPEVELNANPKLVQNPGYQ
jgi:tetratricopeptide (TPR) repeat protein